jgi:glucosyl-dolichyl phosphate glucuronosyltransferase
MEISVIISTYNRSASLKRTLDHIDQIQIPEDLNWELIVVDNNSTDDTREVVERFLTQTKTICRYIHECRQGLSFARNTGIQHALGEIIVFTDDDVIVDKNWIRNISEAFGKHDAACIGGKILPQWEKPCPVWLKGKLLEYLALCDYGNETVRMSEPRVWGANLGIRASIFRKYGLFNTGLGHTGGKLYGGEEQQYLERLLDSGERIIYCPDILVHHCIPAYRINKAYFRKWISDKGELSALQMGEYKNRNIFEIPLIIIRRTFHSMMLYALEQFSKSRDDMQNQLNFYFNIGIIKGRLKYYREKTTSN